MNEKYSQRPNRCQCVMHLRQGNEVQQIHCSQTLIGAGHLCGFHQKYFDGTATPCPSLWRRPERVEGSSSKYPRYDSRWLYEVEDRATGRKVRFDYKKDLTPSVSLW